MNLLSHRFTATPLIACAALAALVLPAQAQREEEPEPCEGTPAELSPAHQAWLDDYALLITEKELAVFLCLSADYERDSFIEEFWKVRDPTPRDAYNELREDWTARLITARELFEDPKGERRRFFLLNGRPSMHVPICPPQSQTKIEAWFYGFPDMHSVYSALARNRLERDQFAIIFHRKWGQAPWKAWLPGEGETLVDNQFDVGGSGLGAGCKRDELEGAVGVIALLSARGGALGFEYEKMVARKRQTPELPSDEWLLTFASYSTAVADDAPRLDVDLELSFPGVRSVRAITQIAATIDAASAQPGSLLDSDSYAFDTVGRILRPDGFEGESLFDSFRYRFEMPADRLADGKAPLAFQRYLRPGPYRLVLLIVDLNGEAVFRREQDFEVPPLEEIRRIAEKDLPPRVEELVATGEIELWDEGNQGLDSEEPSIHIIEPMGDLVTGFVRFTTETTGAIEQVTFSLDEEPILTKRRPPWSVDLSVGELPQSHLLRATAFDGEGNEIANDAYLLNGSPHRFAVRFIDPVSGKRYEKSARVRVQVTVPEGRELDKLELFRNDELVATLFQEPFVQPIEVFGSRQIVVLRALGTLDGTVTAEDTVIINGPADLEQVRVDLVELYTTVTDKDRRPLVDLGQGSFQVAEDGVPQEILRFEKVENTPIRGTILLDVSASMKERLDPAIQAAARFFERVVTERDELSVVSFNDRPQLSAPFTNRPEVFAEGLLGLEAERGTALYDSLIFSLFHLNGLPGQRVVLLLSDGHDEHSSYSFEDTLEYARRSQAAIYTISIGLTKKDKDKSRKPLTQLSGETGGRSFFLDSLDELDGVYDDIARELRSKYLIAYQSSNQEDDGSFRSVEIRVEGGEAHTIRGYYP